MSGSARLRRIVRSLEGGDLAAAQVGCENLLARQPQHPGALHLLGVISLKRGQWKIARQCLEAAAAQRPADPLYLYNLGLSHSRLGEHESAVRCYRGAIRLKPDFSAAFSDLSLSLSELGYLEDAIEAAKTALRIKPDYAAACNNLGTAYETWGDLDGAIQYYEQARDLSPDIPVVHRNLGVAYLGRGDMESAEACLRTALRLDRTYTEVYRHLVRTHKYSSPDHEEVAEIQRLLDNPDLLEESRMHLYFALGKVHDDCGRYDQAFEHFAAGNRLVHRHMDFNAETCADYVDGLIGAFSPEYLESHRDGGVSSGTPIFIVGMPRSGTTLVEQIVSSHPRVYGAGELEFIGRLIRDMPENLRTSLTYPQCLSKLEPSAISSMAVRYLRYIHRLSAGAERVTDKMPRNALRVGLISLMFPNARILYCRRNPLDTCLSIYMQVFHGYHSYAYDLFSSGVFHRQHERLMDHWQAMFPGRILSVGYEDLVAAPETNTRKILDFLGLEWDERCLRYYQNRRRVHTASDWQVHQPIYKSSLDRWRNYAEHLEPLRRGLEWKRCDG